MRRYYSAEGNFDNDTTVLVWSNKTDRDAYVDNMRHENDYYYCYPVTRNRVTKVAANWDTRTNTLSEPKPFTSERWVIVQVGADYEIPGLIGMIAYCDPGEDNYRRVIDTFYH